MLYLNELDEMLDNVSNESDFMFDGDDNDEVIYLDEEVV